MPMHIQFHVHPFLHFMSKAEKEFHADIMKHKGFAFIETTDKGNLRIRFQRTEVDEVPLSLWAIDYGSWWTIEAHGEYVYNESVVTHFGPNDYEHEETVMAYLYEKADFTLPPFRFPSFEELTRNS